MTRRYPKPWRERVRSLYVWHRWIGIVAAPLLVILVVTGWALNHAEGLALDERPVNGPLITWAYDLKIDEHDPGPALRTGGHWITQCQDRVYLGPHRVMEQIQVMQDASAGPGLLALAVNDELALLTLDGALVERLASNALPGPIQAVKWRGSSLVVRTRGSDHYQSADAGLSWESSRSEPWPALPTQQAPARLARSIAQDCERDRISASRLLADLHSGRLFGGVGVLLVDLVGLLLLCLAISGPWLWWRQWRRNRRRQDNSLV